MLREHFYIPRSIPLEWNKLNDLKSQITALYSKCRIIVNEHKFREKKTWLAHFINCLDFGDPLFSHM